MEKVVITGMGAVCSLGDSVGELWDNLLAGKSGFGKIERISTENHDSTVAAEIKNSEGFESVCKKYWTRRQLNTVTGPQRLVLATAVEAIEDCGIDLENYDKDRVAVIYGIADAGFEDAEREKMTNIILKSMPSSAPSLISEKFGFHGASFNLSCACASSGYAIALGAQLIETGVYDMVIAGGVSNYVTHDNISGFNQILAMSANPDPETASRPFTKNRDGFIFGEGAGTVVLESETSAKKRNAKVHAKLSGYACYSESSNMTAPLEDGEGMRIVMERALKKAGVSPDSVDYINAHGTSTYLNDKYETTAIKNLFGKHAYELSVSSTKSAIGHTLAAGSVIEGIVTIKALNENIVPPTIHYDVPDPELDLDYTPNTAKKREINTAMSNSYGFGGQNVSLVFEK
ncbi:MAG: beta-ketoacyl-[acyl-carrier-protein] synthase family protein [Oscillospiraceae bacterium]|nr:beta-ketoacyl-[acyl-carrier-protein] synthase family protein [Oscillospiraceae bacterium]MBQ5336332.1 beta-ketoacyl-[acyl-carrier-protein] synthase family protein [Oscillospiraceae bacterium]